MLRNSFYYILEDNQDTHKIRFNAMHPIFAGHFPGHPIVPGACLVQIAEELAEIIYGYPIRFTAIRDLKFRQPITPDQEVTICIQKVSESMCRVTCVDSINEQRLIISFNAQFDSLIH